MGPPPQRLLAKGTRCGGGYSVIAPRGVPTLGHGGEPQRCRVFGLRATICPFICSQSTTQTAPRPQYGGFRAVMLEVSYKPIERSCPPKKGGFDRPRYGRRKVNRHAKSLWKSKTFRTRRTGSPIWTRTRNPSVTGPLGGTRPHVEIPQGEKVENSLPLGRVATPEGGPKCSMRSIRFQAIVRLI